MLRTEYIFSFFVVIVICLDDNGTFVAYIPIIPGCHAWGRTPEEAQAELVNIFDIIKEE